MTDNDKIKFFDLLSKKFENYINEQAREDQEPMEFDDEDDKGNIVRRYFPTSFQYRKECAVEEVCMQSEDLLPFAYDMFEYLGYVICDTPISNNNQFMEK